MLANTLYYLEDKMRTVLATRHKIMYRGFTCVAKSLFHHKSTRLVAFV